MPRGYAATSLGQIHHRVAGTGRPLVLLPQAGRSLRMFSGLMSELAGDFQVVAFDTPGSGNSDPLPDGTSFEQIAGAFLEACDGLGLDTFDVYGIHTGNKIGASLAVQAGSRVRRLALAGQTHSLVPGQAERNAIIAASLGDALEPAPAAVDWAAKFPRLAELWLDRSVLCRLADGEGLEARLDRVVDELQSMVSMREIYRANFAYDYAADLASLQQPTLVIEMCTAAEDATIGRQGAALAAIIPDARALALEIPPGGSLTLEDRAGEVAELLRGFFA